MAVVGFFMAVFGAMFGIWKFIDSKLRFLFLRTDAVEKDLAAHKLHTAETYVSKQGLRETKEEIMAAIGGVHQAVENMTQRVDRIVENSAKPATRRA